MELNIKNAAKIFFPNPSFEMLFFEAVRNSIDAGANHIEIEIHIKSFSDVDTLRIKISDNGEGFRDKNFEKFKKLLEVESEDHKGLGRLVFLKYFDTVEVESDYSVDEKPAGRKFIFNEQFKGEFDVKAPTENAKTILSFRGFRLNKLYQYDDVKPSAIKEVMLLHFYPLFYRLKTEAKELTISISLTTNTPNVQHDFKSDVQQIKASELPELKEEPLEENIDILSELKLLYSIKPLPNALQKSTAITAICVDERTVDVGILPKKNIVDGYEIIFILYSKFFTGKVDTSRQNLEIDDATLKGVKKLFGDKIAEVLNREIPVIQERNDQTTQVLEEIYPHLKGFFEKNPVGLIDQNEALEKAQAKFFKDQKEILSAVDLTEAQYEKSIEVSSRLLTEYILYRNIIIRKLKEIDFKSSEADVHNVIVPKRKVFSRNDGENSLYRNNAWILDDKYMAFSNVFSDRDIGELISHITQDAVKDASLRPDIAIVFSDELNTGKKVDVVIVELKKLNVPALDKTSVYIQLVQRAQRLLEYYPNQIQRIWFYGIVEIDDELRQLLKSLGFSELYSNGTVMYKHQDVAMPDGTTVPTAFFIQNYQAMIEDAENRNATFLNILKESFKSSVSSNKSEDGGN